MTIRQQIDNAREHLQAENEYSYRDRGIMTTPTVTTPHCIILDIIRKGETFYGLAVRETRFDLHGLTLRQALKALRRVDWGDTGHMLPATLSDGSTLAVRNRPTDDGQGILPGIHVAVREWVRIGKTRTYTL